MRCTKNQVTDGGMTRGDAFTNSQQHISSSSQESELLCLKTCQKYINVLRSGPNDAVVQMSVQRRQTARKVSPIIKRRCLERPRINKQLQY